MQNRCSGRRDKRFIVPSSSPNAADGLPVRSHFSCNGCEGDAPKKTSQVREGARQDWLLSSRVRMRSRNRTPKLRGFFLRPGTLPRLQSGPNPGGFLERGRVASGSLARAPNGSETRRAPNVQGGADTQHGGAGPARVGAQRPRGQPQRPAGRTSPG